MLAVSRTGRALLAWDHQATTILSSEGAAGARDLAVADVLGGVAFDDEVWLLAAADSPVLHRFSLAGERRGDPLPIALSVKGAWIRGASMGGPCAVVSAEGYAYELRLDGGELRVDSVPGRGHVIPIAPRRWVTIRADSIWVYAAGQERLVWSSSEIPRTRMLGGAALLDGTHLALLLGGRSEQWCHVIDLRAAKLRHTLRLDQVNAMRVAPSRGHALFRQGDRRLIAVDMGIGTTHGSWEEARPIIDFALDDGGEWATIETAEAEKSGIIRAHVGERLRQRPLEPPPPPAEALAEPVSDEPDLADGRYPRFGAVRDKYAVTSPAIPCAENLPICRAACCARALYLSEQDLDEGIVKWDYAHPYRLRRGADGQCHHFAGQCTIYLQRPAACRSYDCRGDAEIWLDYEQRIPGPLVERIARRQRG